MPSSAGTFGHAPAVVRWCEELLARPVNESQQSCWCRPNASTGINRLYPARVRRTFSEHPINKWARDGSGRECSRPSNDTALRVVMYHLPLPSARPHNRCALRGRMIVSVLHASPLGRRDVQLAARAGLVALCQFHPRSVWQGQGHLRRPGDERPHLPQLVLLS